MAISLIPGYGLPNEAGGMYNGYGSITGTGRPSRRLAHYGRPNAANNALFRPLPDPELGGYGEFGLVDAAGLGSAIKNALTTDQLNVRTQYPTGGVGGSGGMSLAVVGLAAVALFFFLR